MFDGKPLLDNIFKMDTEKNKYIIFEHMDKTWVLPKRAFKKGMDMYQPSTSKGKILKAMIITFKNVEKVVNKLGARTIGISINEDIKKYIENVCGKSNLEYAVYMGDTSSRQNNKATIQIYNKYGIIAYAKITKDDEVRKTFEKEIEVLNFLKEKQIENVPKILGKSEIEGFKIFVQSTEKNFAEKVKLVFGRKQIECIKYFVENTAKKIDFADADFYKNLKCLKENRERFSDEQRKVLEKSMVILEETIKEKPIEFSFSHGDFTPWNVYYTNGIINVFDFEYCSYSMPSYIDIFHYITQLSLLGKKCDVGGVVHNYKKYRKLIEEYVCNPDLIYICYLLNIISFYKKRTEINTPEKEDKYSKWIGILEYLNEKIK